MQTTAHRRGGRHVCIIVFACSRTCKYGTWKRRTGGGGGVILVGQDTYMFRRGGVCVCVCMCVCVCVIRMCPLCCYIQYEAVLFFPRCVSLT
jgi:hypothetical protein